MMDEKWYKCYLLPSSNYADLIIKWNYNFSFLLYSFFVVRFMLYPLGITVHQSHKISWVSMEKKKICVIYFWKITKKQNINFPSLEYYSENCISIFRAVQKINSHYLLICTVWLK